jgi:putative transposase
LGLLLAVVVTAAHVDDRQGFQVEPHRWKVERTFSWICNDRRNSRDYEVLTCSSEAMIQISTIRMLLKRLIS